jgi:hypothetical protein
MKPRMTTDVPEMWEIKRAPVGRAEKLSSSGETR